MKKENQRVKLTKTLLRNSLVELMHNQLIHKITIKQICEYAGINRSTFYLYYKDQFDLLNDIEHEFLVQIKAHLKEIDSPVNNISFLKELLEYIKDNAKVAKILLFRLENVSFQDSFIGAAIEMLKPKLQLKCEEEVADYIYLYLTMGCLSLIKKWIQDHYVMSIDELSSMIFNLSDHAASIYSK